MYQFKDTIDNEHFFRFDRKLIREKMWARLPLASKAIYPVIGIHCNETGIAFPSEQTIAILAGCTEKTVREGLKGLSRLIGIERKITVRGHVQNIYHYPVAPRQKGRVFFFPKTIIEGGNWSQLSESAKSLYPVVKHFSGLDYCEIEEDQGIDPFDEYDYYPLRKYDYCEADIEVLAEYAGIGRSTAYEAMTSLSENNLIEKTEPLNDYPTWKIFVVPPEYFKREYLNEKIAKKYGIQNLPLGAVQNLPTKKIFKKIFK